MQRTRLAVAHAIFDKYQTEYNAVFPDFRAAVAPFPPWEPGEMAFDLFGDAAQEIVNHSTPTSAGIAASTLLIGTNFIPSPFDRFLAGDTQAMSPRDPARLFVSHAGCRMPPQFDVHGLRLLTSAPQMGQYVNPIMTVVPTASACSSTRKTSSPAG